MKKLIMALAVVACAMAVQASTYNWKSAKGGLYQAGSSTKLVTSGTAYLFDANKYSQTDLIKALFIDKTYASVEAAFTAKGIAGSSNTGILSTGKISASSDFEYNGESAGTAWGAYFVIVDGDNVFVSGSTSTTASSLSDPVTIGMDSPKNASQLAAMDGTKGYSSAGWYTAAPEPTSGLLLLIGMAGLALRRRRA